MTLKQARFDVHIRWMIRRDMDDVLETEALSFEHPWTESDFLRALRTRTVVGMVAESQLDETIVGFMVYELHKRQIEVLNFAVHPSCRRVGVGTAMVDRLKSKINGARRNKLTLVVRERNLEGLLFFKSQGFLATDLLRRHFGEEDAIAMEWCPRHRVEDCF